MLRVVMTNIAKRKKRSKEKAKQARIKKQDTISQHKRIFEESYLDSSYVDILEPDDEMINAFKELPLENNLYENVPLLKKVVLSNDCNDIYLFEKTAFYYVMYEDWLVAGGAGLPLALIAEQVSLIAEDPLFLSYFNEDVIPQQLTEN